MKIVAVSGSRADWGLLSPVLQLLNDDPRFELEIAVTGQHLHASDPTWSIVGDDGLSIDHKMNLELGDDDRPQMLGHSMGLALAQAAAVITNAAPDLVLVLGDRYEILAVASAALICSAPVVHLCGGDVTEGAFDDSIRHAITKLSALHFVTNEDARRRVIQMGENPARVHCVGSTGLDRILATPRMQRADFFESVGLSPGSRNMMVTFHPPTLAADGLAQCDALLSALGQLDEAVGLLFTGSNADPGGRAFEQKIRDFSESRSRAVFHSNLGSRRYFSALEHVDVVIGNSSSGLYEAPSFGVPTVNIGDRQASRLRATSVIDCEPEEDAICAAIDQAMELNCSHVTNPYGDGRSAARIVDVLAAVSEPKQLIRKSFNDLEVGQ